MESNNFMFQKVGPRHFNRFVCSVSIFIKEKQDEFKQDILRRFVNMKFIRQSKGTHKWNKQTAFFKKQDQWIYERVIVVYRRAFKKHSIDGFHQESYQTRIGTFDQAEI